jgi:hypothetical protein
VDPAHLLVRVRFFSSKAGGRRSPAVSPYRAIASFEDEPASTMHDFELQFVDKESANPEDGARAKLIPASPGSWPARRRGERIRIHEGRNHVGDAYVEESHL